MLTHVLMPQVADFGLARSLREGSGQPTDEPAGELTDYVATRWCAAQLDRSDL